MPGSAFIADDDDLAAPWPDSYPAIADRRTRGAVLLLVIGLHAAILALLLWTRHVAILRAPHEASVELDMRQVQPPKTAVTLKFQPLVMPKISLPVVPPPEIVIEPEPSPVAVVAAAAPAANPSPGNGTGQAGGDDYLMRLHNHLARFMIYPVIAGRAREQGIAVVAIAINADHVVKVELAKSSGFDALDREAVALVWRADPLPPMPAGLGPAVLTHVSINFILAAKNPANAAR